jgi:hypothetical protein
VLSSVNLSRFDGIGKPVSLLALFIPPTTPWVLVSSFFLWCACREIRNSMRPAPGYALPIPITPSYLALVLCLAAGFAWPPVHTWYFQRQLSATATELADEHRATVHCNTLFDTLLDPEMLAAGHCQSGDGQDRPAKALVRSTDGLSQPSAARERQGVVEPRHVYA